MKTYFPVVNVDIIEEPLARVWGVLHPQVGQAVVPRFISVISVMN